MSPRGSVTKAIEWGIRLPLEGHGEATAKRFRTLYPFGQRFADHMPRHEIEPFRIEPFPVTDEGWALFMESGGYEGEGWWDTEGL